MNAQQLAQQMAFARCGMSVFPTIVSIPENLVDTFLQVRKETFEETVKLLKAGKRGLEACFMSSETNDVVAAIGVEYSDIGRVGTTNVYYIK